MAWVLAGPPGVFSDACTQLHTETKHRGRSLEQQAAESPRAKRTPFPWLRTPLVPETSLQEPPPRVKTRFPTGQTQPFPRTPGWAGTPPAGLWTHLH